jgi:hypothetical protein
MNQSNTKSEREHIEVVKQLQCSVCDAPAPSDAHHIEQALPYSCVALCKDCHQGSHNGWHGRRAIWKVKKMQEIHALSVTIERLLKSR